jgi:hypothetical protein
LRRENGVFRFLFEMGNSLISALGIPNDLATGFLKIPVKPEAPH